MALAAASETKRLSRGNALSGYRSDGRSLLEGNPVDGRPGPYADEHTRNVVGLSLVQRGDVPTRIASRTGPELITSRNAAGTLGCQTGSGRREQLLSSLVYLIWQRFDTTHQLVHCFVAEEQHTIIGFVTCCVSGHPVMPGLSGEIEELYAEARRHEVQSDLVRQAVTFLQARGAGSIHTRTCVGKECPEEGKLRFFWQSLGWENDMAIFSIYSNVPGDPALQRTWDEYQALS